MKLEKNSVARLMPRPTRFIEWDDELPAFGIRVEPSGKKTFLVRYLANGGGRGAPQRQKTMGAFPVLSASVAREMAKDVLAAVRQGGDPVKELTAKRAEMTVTQAINFYEQSGCYVQRGIRQGEPMKPDTKAFTLARLRHHVVPLLGRRRVTDIEEGDIKTFSNAVAAGKTARDEWVEDPKTGKRKRVIVRGGEGAARKVVRDLSAVYSFLKTHKKKTGVTQNPVEDAPVRKTDNKRERRLSVEEVRRLGAALDELEAEGVNPKALNITRGWALTGCRHNEIAGLLKKGEIDVERGLLILDDTKTGKSVRPIGAAAVALFEALLARVDPDDGSPFLFPAGRGKGHFVGTSGIWPKIIERAKLPGVTPHTLRHTLGSFGGSRGESLLVIGAVLGHANARSTSIYAHVDLDPARQAADRMTFPIARAMGMRSREQTQQDLLTHYAVVQSDDNGFALSFPELPGCRAKCERFDQIVQSGIAALAMHRLGVSRAVTPSAELIASFVEEATNLGAFIVPIQFQPS